MAISVMTWVWDHSKSRHGARLVLLAIADAANADGEAYPSGAELRRKTGLGERAVQNGVAEAVALGELWVGLNQGPNGCNRYRVPMSDPREDCTPAESAPPQILRGTGGDPESPQVAATTPADNAPPQILRGSIEHEESPQVDDGHPAESAPPQNLHPAESAAGTVKQDLSPTERDIYIAREDGPPGKPSKATRASRIPGDFAVSADMAEWARREIPALVDAGRGKYETDRFIDYYRSASGANARKIDWPAAWRNWMRKADDDLGRTPAGAGPARPAPQSGSDRARGQAEALKARLVRKERL